MDADFDTSTLFATSVHARLASGLRSVFTRTHTVNTSELSTIRETMTAIVSTCLYSGMECTLPQALAAAYSVPDGAAIEMACLNVGPAPSDEVCAIVNAYQAIERGNTRAIVRSQTRR